MHTYRVQLEPLRHGKAKTAVIVASCESDAKHFAKMQNDGYRAVSVRVIGRGSIAD